MKNNTIDKIIKKSGMALKPRRPYDSNNPNGYMESDQDFVWNNEDAVMTFMNGGLKTFAGMLIEECLKCVKQQHKLALEFQWDTDDTVKSITEAIENRFGVK